MNPRRLNQRALNSMNRLAHYIVQEAVPAHPEGFTLDPIALKTLAFPRFVFLVSLKGCEQKFYTRPGLHEVADWVRQNYTLLSVPGHYVGGWLHQGIFFLDITVSIRGMAAALNAAYANQQLAIYYPFSGKSFFLPKAA